MSRERPILFSAPMVRALLEGRKTQTRRIVKYRAYAEQDRAVHPSECPYGVPGDRLWVRETFWIDKAGEWVVYDATPRTCMDHNHEVWSLPNDPDTETPTPESLAKHSKKKPSIFMPRWASRILLEIESVRVERVQEISEEDAKAEGFQDLHSAGGTFPARSAFIDYFFDLNAGPSKSEARAAANPNPWVWVLGFRVAALSAATGKGGGG